MKKRGMAAAICLLVGIVTDGHAEVRPKGFSVTPFIGGYTFEGDQHLKTGPLGGIRLGYDYTKRVGVEASLHYVWTELRDPGPSGRDVNVFNYRIDGLYHLLPDARLVPFLAAGLGGVTERRDPIVDHQTKAALNYGAGLKYRLTDALQARADVRHVLVLDKTYNNLEYTIGLGYGWGGGKAPAAAPPPPAAPEVSLSADPATVQAGQCSTLNWSSSNATGVTVEPGVGAVGTSGSQKVCPQASTSYTATAKGAGGSRTATAAVNVTAPPPPPRRVSIRMEIEFATDKSDIPPQGRDEIAKVADFMKKYPWTTAVIEGHTDNIGSAKYNEALSQRRAESVRRYLIEKHGIDASRLTAKGYGFSKPVADNSTPEGRQKNRRIEAAMETEIK